MPSMVAGDALEVLPEITLRGHGLGADASAARGQMLGTHFGDETLKMAAEALAAERLREFSEGPAWIALQATDIRIFGTTFHRLPRHLRIFGTTFHRLPRHFRIFGTTFHRLPRHFRIFGTTFHRLPRHFRISERPSIDFPGTSEFSERPSIDFPGRSDFSEGLPKGFPADSVFSESRGRAAI
jgi:hypothetical protein